MMNPLIVEMYEITIEMAQLLKEDQFQAFEEKLDARQQLIGRIKDTNAITNEEALLLAKIYDFDQQMKPVLKMNMENTKQQINSIKQKKQVSKKFQPYLKQTSGVFLDKKN